MTQQTINNYNILVNQPADKICMWLRLVDRHVTKELSEMLHCKDDVIEVARVLSSGSCAPRI